MNSTMPEKQLPAVLKKPQLWCFSTYFAEGFPFSIIRSVSTVFFRDRGVSLEAVGLTTFFGVPWILKFFWGPLVDEFATKKRWLLVMQAALAVLIGAAAFLVPLPAAPRLIAILFFAGAFVAATHDIAIDGYYLAALDKQEQTKFLGYRVMAYRVAMLTGTGVIVTIGTAFSWTAAFLCAGLLLGLLAAYHYFFLPECETERHPFKDMFRSLRPLARPAERRPGRRPGRRVLPLLQLGPVRGLGKGVARLAGIEFLPRHRPGAAAGAGACWPPSAKNWPRS